MPTCEMPQPHWKQAVSTPKDAAAESRLVTAAWSGTSTDRNAIISRRNPSRITVPITSSRRSVISWARSTYDAVKPPTYDVMPFTSTGGRTSLRTVLTRVAVSSEEGDVDGTADSR